MRLSALSSSSLQKWILLLVLLSAVALCASPVLAEKSATPLWIYTTGLNSQSIAVSADGQYVAATGSADSGESRVSYFTRDGTLLWSYTEGKGFRFVAVSADGQYIAAGTSAAKVYYFTRDGTLLWSSSTGYPVSSVSVSSDGGYIATTGSFEWQGKVSYFSRDGTLLWSLNPTTNSRSVSGAVSADGQYVATAGAADSIGTLGKVYYFKRDGTLFWSYGADPACLAGKVQQIATPKKLSIS